MEEPNNPGVPHEAYITGKCNQCIKEIAETYIYYIQNGLDMKINVVSI